MDGVERTRRTLVAVLTLALGIGANTSIFSLADAVLLRTLPVSKPRDLVVLRQRGPAGDIFPFTSVAAVDLAASRDVLSGLAAFRPVLNTHVSVNGETELALMQLVSGNYHAVLGSRAVVGRTLTEQDREPVAVISHRYWRRRFGGDPNVVGRVLEMQGRSFTIVGVTPPEFFCAPAAFGCQPGRPGRRCSCRRAHACGTLERDRRAGCDTRAVGIYSMVASAVARRQREIGIRMALGAVPGQVARMVVSEAFGIVAGALAIGAPAAFAAALAARSLLAGVLFELSPTDPLILLSSTAAILLISSLAAYVPARRAARIDPVASLKYE